ncbi:MAG: hypothetical protein AAF434_03905 [Pseudomonadota bacterium]
MKHTRSITLGVVALGLSATVNSAQISVHVTDGQLGKSLSGAAVCLGTPANPVQFGGQLTQENGHAVFDDVPETPLVLTISRTDYTGYQRTHGAKQFDITLQVGLQSGGLGPLCELGELSNLPQMTDGAITVSALKLNGGARSTGSREITINASTTGAPTHYRVAEHWSFDGAEWLELSGTPKFTLSRGAGSKAIYFQVRRLKSLAGGEVESLSGIAQTSIVLTN